jgi:hypothetical protein
MVSVNVPRGIPTFTSDQSKHEHLPTVPLRAVVCGPSGSGKTLLIISMLVDLYTRPNGDSVFSRIYVFSPSVHSDPAWTPVKDFIEKKMKIDEQWAWDHYDPGAMLKVIEEQRAIIAAAKERGLKKLFNILIVVDDFADDPRMSRQDRLLHSLFTRGRHAFCSTIVASQKFRALSPIIRVNATALIVFRLRSDAEKQAIVEEVSAAFGKDVVASILRHATEQPYSFLYIDLAAKRPDQMFWLRFEKRLVPATDTS